MTHALACTVHQGAERREDPTPSTADEQTPGVMMAVTCCDRYLIPMRHMDRSMDSGSTPSHARRHRHCDDHRILPFARIRLADDRLGDSDHA